MPRFTIARVHEGSRELTSHRQESGVLVGFDERNKRRIGGFLGEGGTVWEMTATHKDALLDSEECHERVSHCASVYEDSLVGSFASARGVEMAIPRSYSMGCH